MWNKPSREDIDAWEKLGNEGWNWDRFDKYMQRATTYTPPVLSEVEHARRGTPDLIRKLWQKPIGNGPIQLSHPPTRIDVDIKAQHTFQNMGIAPALAPLNGDPNGLTISAMTVDPKTILRSFAANAYWAPNSSRPNFNLLTGAIAHRLLSTHLGGELLITGVEFSHSTGGEATCIVRALKEVILSAGAIKTPQLLELSGIGRPDILERAGIPLKLALDGVGENVQEHINSKVVLELKDSVPDETLDILRDLEVAEKHRELFSRGQGVYTMGISNFIFAPLNSLSDKADELILNARKQIEAEIAVGKYSPLLAEQYKILLDHLEKKVPSCEIIGFPGALGGPNPPAPGKKYYTILSALNALFSRGTIHVTTSDPNEQPAMDPHYFEQEIDLKMLLELVKFGRKVARTAPLKDYFDEVPFELNPGSGYATDQDMSEYLKSNIGTTFHTVGSASMLPRKKGGVVDTNLKVYGTKNLRVADLSIVPLHVGSHTQCIAYGIGEIAADIIKDTS